jgi:hypothetical protein
LPRAGPKASSTRSTRSATDLQNKAEATENLT